MQFMQRIYGSLPDLVNIFADVLILVFLGWAFCPPICNANVRSFYPEKGFEVSYELFDQLLLSRNRMWEKVGAV
jgi:hypothetical protein